MLGLAAFLSEKPILRDLLAGKRPSRGHPERRVLRVSSTLSSLSALVAAFCWFIPITAAFAADSLSVESVFSEYSVVAVGQQSVPLEITVKNESAAGIFVGSVTPLFTNVALNDRAIDYILPGEPIPGVIIMPGVSHVFSISVGVSESALAGVEIRIDAAITGYRLDTSEMVSDSSAAAPHTWTVTSEYLNAFVGFFDARLTPARSDDSLIARTALEKVPFNTVHYLNNGAPIADLPYERGAVYRLVFQFNPSATWDYEPKLTEGGTCALAGSMRGFGRMAAPNPGIRELLLTEAYVPDQFADGIDNVVGMTQRTDPPQSWSMVSDPWTDAGVMTNLTGEIGSLKPAVPGGAFVDCMDATATWELAAQCRVEQYYFYEFWFQSDLDWEPGDTVDVYLYLHGIPEPLNLEQLHVRFRLADDDTDLPNISDFGPEIVPANESFKISCRISDASGVYDDDTGSSGQGVYLLWDDDGSIVDDANEIQMSSIGDGYYVTDVPIGARSEGDLIVYAVHACDDDVDGGEVDDRSCGASDVRTVQIVGTIYLSDEQESLYPATAYSGSTDVSIHVELNNPMSQDIGLDRASTVSFTDGTRIVTANLRNATIVPAGASHFPVSFDTIQIPFDFIAPDTVDIKLDFAGVYNLVPFNQSWIASVSNRLIVMKPRILLTARPAVSGNVYPGNATGELLRIDVKNDSPAAVSIDSLVISNVTTGGGGAPLNDVDFGPLRLYGHAGEFASMDELVRDGRAAGKEAAQIVVEGEDGPALQEAPSVFDSLLAWGRFEGGEARLRFPGGESISAGTTRYWYAVADVDSFLASDGDSLDVAIMSPDSVFITGNASVEYAGMSLNSDGKCAIDGFSAFQLRVEEAIPDTLYLGDADQPVLSFVAPVNGHAPDILSAVSIGNFGDGDMDDLIERLAFWRDNGDGVFSPLSDLHVGDFAATGDRFELSGLSLTLLAPQRFFAVADFALGTFGVLEARFGIPAGGIEYVSGNDGPIDGDVAPDYGQVLLRREIVSIDALPILPGRPHPGEGGVELLALRVDNNTLNDITVDSLRVRGDSTIFPCEPTRRFKLYVDDGDSSFEPGADTAVAAAEWSGGEAFFVGAGSAIAPGSQRILYVATDLDSFLTVDGETLSVGIESADDIGLTIAPSTSGELFRLDADFPLMSEGFGVTDGMLAHQVTLYPHGDSVIVEQKENVLVLDLLVPGNACIGDTLQGLMVTNFGTAGSKQINRFLLWRDDGDGIFDPASDQSVAALSETAAKTYAVHSLSEPLGGFPGSRFFVTMDVLENVETGGTVDLAIPVMGISVVSGNDGPIDRFIDGPGIFTIPIPDRLTLFTSILGNKRVLPGEENVLNLVLGMFNSYEESTTLQKLILLSVGSSRLDEITTVEAYADSDEDGLFNPAIDSLLEVAESTEAGYSFDELGAVLRPYRTTLLFISYGTALVGMRDSIRIDFQVSDKTSIVFQGTSPVVEGDFPLNSAGVDITNGMVNAQLRMLPVPDARVSPGAVEIPCLSLMLPCNGIVEDVLEGFSVANGGTASPGQDVRYVKLWKDTGSTPFAFDSGDEFLAFLVWDGSSWKTVEPLAAPIPCGGLVLHVTADIASTAQDGRSLSLCVPLDGVLVSSGNDGPVDERACGTALIEISTDPLLAWFAVPAAVTRDQVFDVRMGAANAADTTLLGVVPDSFAYAGTGSCSPVSGPVPVSMDLPGKSEGIFTWTFRALSVGELVFRGRVKQDAGPEASRVEPSETIRVDEIPEGVTVTLVDLAPVSLNRGQEDVALIEMTLGYDPASGQGAPVSFASIELAVTNGAAAPLPVKDAASKIRIRDEVRLLCSVETDAISQPSVICQLSEPLIFYPGGSTTLKISIDIPIDATASDFRLSIASSGKIALADYNSGAPVSSSGCAFPWATNTVALRDPASALLVHLISSAPARVNTGQEDVGVFDLVLENGGGASAAPVSVSEIVFVARDADGDTIDAGTVLEAFRLAGDAGNTYTYLENFAGSASIRCAVQPALTVVSGVPVALHGKIDCTAQPAAPGFSIALEDSLDVAARDANSGQAIEVQGAGGFPGFPMSTGVSLFSAPLVSVAASGIGLMEERIVAGTTNAAALRLVLAHPGAAQESPFSCSGITVRLLDELGDALLPVDVLDAVKVRTGTVDIAAVYVNASHGSDIPLVFSSPLVASPGEADTLDILFDLDPSPARSRFQLHVNAAGIDVADTTDGREDIPLTGSFPVTSGLGTIIFPAGGLLFAAEGLLPANMAQGVQTECMGLEFSRGDESSGSQVFVEGLTLEVLDEGDRIVDPAGVIGALRISDESGEIATSWNAVDGRIAVSFVDTVAVGENETRSLALAITSVANPTVKALSLRIAAPEAVSCRDEATGGTVTVSAASGAFPFGSGKTAVLSQDLESAFSNYPNPFIAGSEKTTITFFMPGGGKASVRVFTITGEPVRTIVDAGSLAAGLHQEFSWDGRNGNGTLVMNGVYYLVLKVSADGRDYTFKRKVALVQ